MVYFEWLGLPSISGELRGSLSHTRTHIKWVMEGEKEREREEGEWELQVVGMGCMVMAAAAAAAEVEG